MDFFEAQDRARRRSKRLVFLFILAVIGIVISSYVAVMAGINVSNDGQRLQSDYWEYQRTARWSGRPFLHRWWNPQLFLAIAGGTVAVVGLASRFKWAQMRQGGSAVAEMVGGRVVDP
jgi:hypothetical protein